MLLRVLKILLNKNQEDNEEAPQNGASFLYIDTN